jgi:hypothetical protein
MRKSKWLLEGFDRLTANLIVLVLAIETVEEEEANEEEDDLWLRLCRAAHTERASMSRSAPFALAARIQSASNNAPAPLRVTDPRSGSALRLVY